MFLTCDTLVYSDNECILLLLMLEDSFYKNKESQTNLHIIENLSFLVIKYISFGASHKDWTTNQSIMETTICEISKPQELLFYDKSKVCIFIFIMAYKVYSPDVTEQPRKKITSFKKYISHSENEIKKLPLKLWLKSQYLS